MPLWFWAAWLAAVIGICFAVVALCACVSGAQADRLMDEVRDR